MGKLVKILILLAALALLFGMYACKTKQIANTTTNVKDSVNVNTRVIVKDSLVYTKVDSAAIKALVKCPDGTLINMPLMTKKSKHATSSFEIKNGIATAKCVCDSQAIVNRTTTILKSIFKERLKDVSKSLVVEKKVTPPWVVKTMATLIVLLALSILINIKLFK